MANADNPFGFRPVSTLTGGDWKGLVQTVAILAADSTATFIGDAVKLTGSGTDDGLYPSVAQCAAGNNIDYVIVGFEPDFANESFNQIYRSASTLRLARAVPVQNMIFEIQEDSDGGSIAITAVGEFCDIVVAAGSTATGVSKMELDSSNAGTGDQVRLLGIGREANNELGTNAIWQVVINESNLYAVGTAV